MLVSGYWILKGSYPYFITAKDGIYDQYQVSSIQYQPVKWYNCLIFISTLFGSGLSGLGL